MKIIKNFKYNLLFYLEEVSKIEPILIFYISNQELSV